MHHPNRKIRVLLADDHELVRHGFAVFLNGQTDMEVVGEASNGREAIELAERLRPDIIVMDVTMPELGGVEATRRIRDSVLSAKVLAVSMHKDSVYVREILRAGADGYLLKDSRGDDMLAAIRAVWNGEGYISPAVSQAVLEDYRKQAKAPIDLLTARERDVLQLVAEGFTNKEIASKLKLSVYTAEGYRARIMEKLNLHSTGELVRFAMRSGLID
jgi:two-component system response regulator NreC